MSITAADAQVVLDNADCLYSKNDVEQAIVRLSSEITEKLRDKNPIILCVMNGGLVPAGLLITHLNFPLQVDYLHATRYRGKTNGSDLHWLAKPQFDLKDRVVLVIDDILDEGLTLKEILAYCRQQGVKDLYSAVLVEKLHDRKTGEKHADFIGLQVEDRYVFGFGMDYKGFLRNAPGIYAVKGE
ncbi:MAG: hypoxanthine-guanine phosphoribosyltransferase [Gammaproteobacteria bacterium]|nr:hypoxanthine-guanine phosphoribosyltransferase [Gammaproteobacteria bacterium]